ncbi:hypothetical protein M409DRAFT_24123 [Zasmidium cellare ATCC 36951]|uniref:MOSC domain-containing protein n=1 Tax=Zasmidium cellare ATCC 36951 TaxID=1080233 RepID=A0A6A6CK97_ZASCE|nr:uncharacterized protein M409DRAFT_24123 [Zasmidium cellare ATCC 36951]KAF2165836.1 hypothetical protein M409DRAFT_24123 [Zasmidium cellare ATCC 36951]
MTPPNLKHHLSTLSPAPIPSPDPILQVRTGKIGTLGPQKLPSAIYKQMQKVPIYVTEQGLTGDQHYYPAHKESHRAVHQYASKNYLTWQKEKPDLAHLFQNGGFGENLVATDLIEESVCIGDIWCVGDRETGLLMEVSEPRNPCYKLNARFQWSRALPRIQKTGRVGWNFRVLRPGYVSTGDEMWLVERPNPCWSIMNVVRVLHGKSVEPALYEECTELRALSPYFHDLALKRLAAATRTYTLVEAAYVTSRVRQLTFEVKNGDRIKKPEFRPYAYAQISFGPEKNFSRCYSIVDGNLEKFTLGVALDGQSRGGSRYLHEKLQIGDEIKMGPGLDPEATEHEDRCMSDQNIENRIVLIGGIGVTAFLPAIRNWENQGVRYEIHFAVRSMDEAAYKDVLPQAKTTFYAKWSGDRLNLAAIIPRPAADGKHTTRIFCCGPSKMMAECQALTTKFAYPPHLLHFESFGTVPTAGSILGDPFEVEVHDTESERKVLLDVPADRSLLRVLNDAGFDVMSSCQSGGCGMCKVAVCGGEAVYNSSVNAHERPDVMMTCVDRAKGGRVAIEID